MAKTKVEPANTPAPHSESASDKKGLEHIVKDADGDIAFSSIEEAEAYGANPKDLVKNGVVWVLSGNKD